MRLSISNFLICVLALSSSAFAAPTLEKRLPYGYDPKYSINTTDLAAGLSCTSGSPKTVKNPILLVPATGTTGSQSFESNWVPLAQSLGFTPCYVSPPPSMLGDVQINAEYVAYAIKRLYKYTGENKVPVLAWSQGGLATQWALTFFPSLRAKTSRFIAFAPDYKGTVASGLLKALGSAEASIWQQTSGSAFTTALANAGGLNQIVPTTNLYSSTDELVQPQISNGAADSSYLINAKNIQAQQLCGSLFALGHSGTLTSSLSFAIGSSALKARLGRARGADYSKADCNPLPPNQLSLQQKLANGGLLVTAASNIATGPKTSCEPDLKPYARKYAVGKTTCSGVIKS